MAVVRPFRAHAYACTGPDVSALVAPPYDVISAAQRAGLIARDPRNVVALELPDGPRDASLPGNRYETGAALWERWGAEGILRRDPEPALYVLEQRFELGGRPVRRRAFVAAVGLEPLDGGVILPHERTLPKALSDRLELLRATRVNTSPVFGLYSDPHGRTDSLFAAGTSAHPTLRAEDADGVVSEMWTVTDPGFAAEVEAFFAPERIFIADGHHRYTVALAYRDERRAAEPVPRPGDAPSHDSVMMALVNMDDPDLAVLPYNRVAEAAGDFDRDAFYAALGRSFEIEDIDASRASGALERLERPGFLVKARGDDRPRLARLRAGVDPDGAIAAPHSSAWKSLDVAVVQELVLAPLLGIHPDRPETLDRIVFTRDAADAFAAVGEHDLALVLRPTRMDQLRAVALAGETMPQKSTYFYPKLLSGLLFRALD